MELVTFLRGIFYPVYRDSASVHQKQKHLFPFCPLNTVFSLSEDILYFKKKVKILPFPQAL